MYVCIIGNFIWGSRWLTSLCFLLSQKFQIVDNNTAKTNIHFLTVCFEIFYLVYLLNEHVFYLIIIIFFLQDYILPTWPWVPTDYSYASAWNRNITAQQTVTQYMSLSQLFTYICCCIQRISKFDKLDKLFYFSWKLLTFPS